MKLGVEVRSSASPVPKYKRHVLPIRTEVKTQPASASYKASSPIVASSATPSGAGVETSLNQIKELIENQTKVISAQNDKIGLLTNEVESLKKKLNTGSQDQSERIRQLELELEEARS